MGLIYFHLFSLTIVNISEGVSIFLLKHYSARKIIVTFALVFSKQDNNVYACKLQNAYL